MSLTLLDFDYYYARLNHCYLFLEIFQLIDSASLVVNDEVMMRYLIADDHSQSNVSLNQEISFMAQRK
jgi:hypothetical protein